jgi:hypothetical protein
MVDDENGSHGEVVFEGNVKIEWRNESEEYTYKLLRIFDIEYDDKNAVKSADYEIIMEFNVFVHDEETESMLTTLCKMKELPEDSYYIVQYKENKPCRVVAMFFYNPTDNTYGSYLDNCAEYNFRVIASAALDCDIV